MGILELSTILLTLASVFTLINIRLLKLPQTIGLMILALCLSVILTVVGIIFPQVFEAVTEITREFDFSELLVNVMLPFLLFAGAISVNVHELLKDKVTILLLASFGVLFSTFAVGTGVYWLIQQPMFGLTDMGLTYIDCLLFGALIAPTDPIAVLAMIKKMNLSSITETRIAGESLFNDGIGVVVFLTLLGNQTGWCRKYYCRGCWRPICYRSIGGYRPGVGNGLFRTETSKIYRKRTYRIGSFDHPLPSVDLTNRITSLPFFCRFRSCYDGIIFKSKPRY